MIVIVAGETYIDIDAYASGIAYAKLLCACGKEAKFAPMASTNSSVCKVILDLGFEMDMDYAINQKDEFIVVDVSSPDFINTAILKNNIVEVIDHHYGFKEYWDKKHIKNQIESIGSVATIVYERIVKSGKQAILTQPLCKLLIAAILDNTVNLTSSITSPRDVKAYHELRKIGNVPSAFDEEYFLSCQETINKDVLFALQNDMKCDKTVPLLPGWFGQLLVYEKEPILNQLDNITEFLNTKDNEWMINIICLKDKKSYIVVHGKKAQQNLVELLHERMNGNIMILPKPMLRKEIIKKAILYKNS